MVSGEWPELLGRLPWATEELILERLLPRRSDSKFLMSPPAAAELVRALPRLEYGLLPAGAEAFASYRTLYFDTAELDFFHDHRRGRRVRHKVRVRHYRDRRLTFLEVKTRRSELQTIKTRLEREYGDDELDAEGQGFVDLHTQIGRNVLPQAWTDFRRLMLFGVRTNERVTIDLDLVVGTAARSEPLGDIAVVEVKQWPYDHSTPVMSALRARGSRPGWLSKYCVAIARTRPDVVIHRLLPGLRALDRIAA